MELSTDWELDTPVPSWLQKMMEQHKLLISQTDPSERFKSTKERILDLQTTFSTALNIVHPKNDWTVLEPIAERCLQSLSRLDSEYRGAEPRTRFICDENPNNNTIPFAFIEEIDYLDKDVSHILELACYTGEMVSRSSRDQWCEATDAPDNAEQVEEDDKVDIGSEDTM
ncbi:12905_t:CDS:2 [Entrophospora sp. SA101]|nr:12905_t:CDS:2 [Entrophospora sp. SA101]